MKNKFVQRTLALLLALVCVLGALPLSAFAAGLSSAPGSITQRSSDYMKIGGRSVRYKAASSDINNVGLPYVFDEQVTVPGLDAPVRALCAYQRGTLGPGANGQKWNFQEEVNCASLKVLLTYIYAHTYGNFTDAGNAVGLEHWNNYWSDIWFLVAQAMSWYYEHGIIKDVNSDREGFIEQASEEFVAAMRLYHETYGQSSWITDWSKIGTHSIIDSKDGGATGYSAYDYVSTGVNLVMDHPEYYHSYHLWIYDWDKSQPWKLPGQSGVPMQRLLIVVPDPEEPAIDTVQLTVRKLEAGTNKPMSGVSFKIENANDPAAFSVTRATGADGTITLTKEADDLTAGQYLITEEAVPEGYVAQTASQLVTVLPNSSANSVFTFYNEPESPDTPTPDTPSTGTGTIKKVDADNPTVGIPGAVIRITSVKLDDGGSFFGEYVTKDGGYILKEDLDFSSLPKGSYLAEEITPPEGYILSSDVSKVKQPFVWDGKTDVSLVFENSSKVKVMLKKVDESSAPLAGAIFVILRDGQVIGTEETKADGTITVSNVTEGYYEFREVSAPAGFDCDRSPVGVHVEAEDLQGEQTIVVTKMNHHKRTLTIQKRDAETGDPIPGTSFHVRGVNLGYENDVVTGADGAVTLSDMPSGCYEVTETDVPKPYILDSNNRKTVWIDAEKDQDVTVDFVNSKLPGVRLVKRDRQTNQPIPGVTFKIEEVDGGFTDQRQTDKDGVIFWENLRPGAYKVYEVEPAPNYVHDDTVHVVHLEPDHTTTIELTNILKPTLKVVKVDSITHSPIAKVKFQIWRGSDDTITGELNDLGVFQTNDSGEIVLEHIDTGWYRIKELEPAPGYTIKQPDTQDIYLKAGETHTVTFENTPKNCIIVEKYDSVTGEALGGCTFQLRYLAGTSGTGGTVIGQKVTNKNGVAMWTGLEPGAYVLEEVDPADGYSIINSSETVYLASKEDKTSMFLGYSELLNALDAGSATKLTINNKRLNRQDFERKILLPRQDDYLDGYRAEYNAMLMDKVTDSSNSVVQERYVTLSVHRKSIEEARTFFDRVTADVTTRLNHLDSHSEELNAVERLRVLHDFYRTGEETEFHMDLRDLMRKGHSFKDAICPDSLEFKKDHFIMGGKYGRVLFLKEYASYIKDSMVNELTALNRTMMLSIDVIPVPTDEAVREMQSRLLGVETNVTNWQRRQNNNNNFSAVVPYDLEQQRKETREMLDDLTTRDQRMMFAVVTLVHLADSKEELDSDTETLQATARKHLCQLATLSWQQADGLVTALPLGLRRIDALRTLTTEALAVLMPFKAQEVRDRGGVYYGQNTISKNLIIANRKELLNGNGFVLGVSGSGKSFTAKVEMVNVALATNDDIIVLDPEAEYRPIVEGLGGEVIDISATSRNHINAMDMEQGYGDGDNPVVLKSEFLLSLCEQLVGSGKLSAKEKSIIDRCTAQCYHEYIRGGCKGKAPTLQDFHAELLRQPEPEAKDVALAIELFTEGSLNTFAKPTNVDTDARILCYDIRDLGKQLLPVGMLVVLDSVFNRIIRNRALGRNTWIYIDEIYILFQHEYSANFLFTLWKRVRKYRALCSGITQNVDDLLQSHTARTMLANSEFLVMLNQAGTDRAELASLLNISENQLSYITNVDAGRGLIKCGSAIVPFVNSFPKNTHLYRLMSTKFTENQAA